MDEFKRDIILTAQIASLISRGQRLLQDLSQELNQTQAPDVGVAKDLIAEGSGQFITELLNNRRAGRYGKKLTKNWLEGNIKANRQAISQKFESSAIYWENEIIALLNQVSISARGLIEPGNSDKLVHRIHQVDRYTKLETRIKHIIIELQSMAKTGLVYNSTLPLVSVVRFNPREDLKTLETSLRKFIQRELNKVTPNWWQRVPAEIIEKAERRRTRAEVTWPWYSATSIELIDYLDFSDYKKIILEKKNWQEVFCKFFINESFIEVRLSELEPIRNDIAHSRNLSDLAVQRMKIYSMDLGNCVK